ncbi:MAG TPA: glycerol kinase GlpK [Tepidisphaeraceae bacterium]|nr:glycerol kinase GlpK [Tepidisphaeraceae bacterium]
MKHVLAIDQGTTSSRTIIFDLDGNIISQAQREFTQHYPQPSWVEHDAEEIFQTQLQTIIDALANAHLTNKDIACIGITNQRETIVVWDRATGKPIHRAIVWQDRRTTDRIEQLKSIGLEPMIRSVTGLIPDPYFSATKIGWILDHVSGARARAQRGELCAGTIDTWLAWKLTGRHITDASNASRTMLAALDGKWDRELLRVFDVPRELLPEIVESSGNFGECKIDPVKGIPLTGIAGDQQAALFGQRCVESGNAKCTYGTGCFMLMNTGDRAQTSKSGLLTTIAWKRNSRINYALEGSVFVGGAVVQWLRDGLGLIGSSSEIESLARHSNDSGGVVFVPAFAGLGAPHWEPDARGTIFGLTRGTTGAQIARAALESIAFQVVDLFEAMSADSPSRATVLRVDGGASANNLLMQLQADLLNVRIERPSMIETTAFGAARLAAEGFGLDEFARENSIQIDQFEPQMSRDESESMRANWKRAINSVLAWSRA